MEGEGTKREGWGRDRLPRF